METIITDKCSNSAIYNKIIVILDQLTGIKWGYVQTGRRVKYLSSVELPIKIGILWGKKYEKNIKYKLDISVHNKSPKMFVDDEIWSNAVGAELQVGLRCILEIQDSTEANVRILATVNSWKSEGEFAETIIYADEQLRKYAATGAVLDVDVENGYDTWMEGCLVEI